MTCRCPASNEHSACEPRCLSALLRTRFTGYVQADSWLILGLRRHRQATGAPPGTVHLDCATALVVAIWGEVATCPPAGRTVGGVVLMAERHLTMQRRMAAPRGSVWALIADFPNLASNWSGLRETRDIAPDEWRRRSPPRRTEAHRQ